MLATDETERDPVEVYKLFTTKRPGTGNESRQCSVLPGRKQCFKSSGLARKKKNKKTKQNKTKTEKTMVQVGFC